MTTAYFITSRALRPLRTAACLALLASSGCAAWERAWAPAQKPWPVSADGRVRRDGRLLRVYGASLKSREESDEDARRALERWLWRLELGDEIPERQALIRSVLDSPQARPVPSPVPQAQGFSSIIELDLPALQRKLGTYYD